MADQPDCHLMNKPSIYFLIKTMEEDMNQPSVSLTNANDGGRIRSLASKAMLIERQIVEERRHPLPDPLKLSALKRRKLKIKDEIRGILNRRVRE